MKIGEYQIGRSHAIIKKIYEDGSIDYETSFSDEGDFFKSVYAVRRCIGKLVGIATINPRVLKDVILIRGKEEITKELDSAR